MREDESRGGSHHIDGQTWVYLGRNRVGKKGTYMRESEMHIRDKGKQATRFEDMDKEIQRIRSEIVVGRVDYISSGSLQIREPLLVPNSGMTDQCPPEMGKKKKRRSPENRARYRENKHLRRLKEVEGCALSETEDSEFERLITGGDTQQAEIPLTHF